MIDIKNFHLDELKITLTEYGFQKFRATQIFNWIYDKGIFDFNLMSNISKKDREALSKTFSIYIPEIPYILKSNDGTIKFAIKLKDNNIVESVLIPDDDRLTLCVSTQVGCRMGCKFCLTGKQKFIRNLEPHEIIDQVLVAKFLLLKKKIKITNIVYMGMGEPLDNIENTITSLKILNDDNGFNFSNRKITISTCGIYDKFKKLSDNFDGNLAISLHSADNEKRTFLMPVNKKYPLEKLIEHCKKYPLKNRQRITFEYILIKDVNDSINDAEKLYKILKGIKAKINLIKFNEYPGSEFKALDDEKVEEFQRYLFNKGLTALLRKSKGKDILAACGQLFSRRDK